VLHVDNLIKTRFEQIVVISFLLLFRSHQNPQKQCLEGITNGLKSESKSQGNDYQTITFLQLGLLRISENPRRTKAAEVFHRRLSNVKFDVGVRFAAFALVTVQPGWVWSECIKPVAGVRIECPAALVA
jgi:hypothetical protein